MGSSPTALVIGGTGPTGPYVVQGLLDRGHEVTILHRGNHEPPELPDVRHIHADPHFEDTLREALGASEFDVVLGMYGRAGIVARVLEGRCGDYVSISGVPVYVGYNVPRVAEPYGMAIGVSEDGRLVDQLPSDPEGPIAIAFAQKILATEQAVVARHPNAMVFRYPMIYGPRNVLPWEWSVVKRVLDGRRWMVLPDQGLSIHMRCAAENAAHAILLALDQRNVARGEVFNVGDDDQVTLRQWVEVVSTAVGRRLDVRSLPREVCPDIVDAVMPQAGDLSPHTVIGTHKIRSLLGYRDLIDAREAMARSARWHAANPLDDLSPFVAYFDRFDYEREDALVARHERYVADVLRDLPPDRPAPIHAQAHPVSAGAGDKRGR